MGKKNPNDSQKTFQISEEERQARNKQLGEVSTTGTELKGIAGTGATATKGIADTTASAVNPALERFYDPSGAGMSEWKRGQINTRTSGTTKAFDSALAAQRQRAKVAGFGYLQPAEQAGETNLGIGRAGALSRIRGDVENEAIPIEMEALKAREASGAEQAGTYGAANALEQSGFGDVGRLQLGEAGEYSPEDYYKTGANQAEQEAQRRGALWKSLGKLGTTAAGAVFGGLPGAKIGASIWG
jgi:hypothetical protein